MDTTTNNDDKNNSVFLQLAGRKLKERLGSTMNESSGSAVPAFAKKQLEKLGWKQGEGLGKNRQGMVSHIKVTKREEGLGLGESTLEPAIAQSLNADDWWKNSVGDTLAKLAGKTQKKKKRDSKSSKKVYTDEELFEATGGARFGMRAQRRQDAKWKRAESNISEQDEKEAMDKVEWDGMTAPKIIFNEEPKASKKRKVTGETPDKKETVDEKAERKRQKKEKKKLRPAEVTPDPSVTVTRKKKSKSKTKKDQ
jgi:Pin2-interacting protein X1